MPTIPPDLSSLFPGFDALQSMARGATAAMPGLGPWVTPTLDPAELGKRIEELKTVQFWLEQNARMLSTTVQALEVQRMTLTTLQTMNVQAHDLADAFKIRTPSAHAADPVTASAPAAATPAPPSPSETQARRRNPRAAQASAGADADSKASTPGPAGLVDPMQWWGSLAQQFTQIAAQSLKEAPPGAMAAPAPASPSAQPASARSARPQKSSSARHAARRPSAR